MSSDKGPRPSITTATSSSTTTATTTVDVLAKAKIYEFLANQTLAQLAKGTSKEKEMEVGNGSLLGDNGIWQAGAHPLYYHEAHPCSLTLERPRAMTCTRTTRLSATSALPPWLARCRHFQQCLGSNLPQLGSSAVTLLYYLYLFYTSAAS